ncbi:hypothetical protein [Thermoactinospora rubra]|uniref:hypothetical protein n=1 Tax=Thermoactinospora rubra TaxID=1088767 RepID=UPI000A10F49F|nr:hypothetical protein [Thermoactinospora rubra]
MTSRDFHDDDLEAELLALGDSLEVPSPPPAEVAAAVRARLESPDPAHDRARPRPAVPRRRWRLVAVIAVVVLALTAAALTWVLRAGGVELRIGEPAPTPSVTRPIPGEGRVTLEEARRAAPFPVRVPAALGEPAEVRLSDNGRIVSMLWPGGVRLDQFDGGLHPLFLKRLDTWPDMVSIGVHEGWWIARAHPVSYLTRADGTELPLRVADATLVWGEGTRGYRLEGIRDRDRAVEVARSLR